MHRSRLLALLSVILLVPNHYACAQVPSTNAVAVAELQTSSDLARNVNTRVRLSGAFIPSKKGDNDAISSSFGKFDAHDYSLLELSNSKLIHEGDDIYVEADLKQAPESWLPIDKAQEVQVRAGELRTKDGVECYYYPAKFYLINVKLLEVRTRRGVDTKKH
jgi:hypothetical protein